ASHLVDAARVHCVPDAVKHEPCGPLSNLQVASNLVGTYAVLAVGNQPHGTEPLVQADSGVLEDRADLDGNLLAATKARPEKPCLEKRQLLAAAFWALRAFRPLRFSDR